MWPNSGNSAARHDLRLAFFADAVAHLVEAVIDEIELEIVVIDAFGIQAEHAHLAELERHAAGAAEIAAALGEDGAHLRDGARGVVGGGLDDDRDAVRRVALIDDLFVGRRVLARGALDGGLDLVLGHVEVAAVLNRAPQRRIGIGVGAAGLDGDVDVFGDARELLGHAVPAREHRVFSYFEDASHRARILAAKMVNGKVKRAEKAAGGTRTREFLAGERAWKTWRTFFPRSRSPRCADVRFGQRQPGNESRSHRDARRCGALHARHSRIRVPRLPFPPAFHSAIIAVAAGPRLTRGGSEKERRRSGVQRWLARRRRRGSRDVADGDGDVADVDVAGGQ